MKLRMMLGTAAMAITSVAGPSITTSSALEPPPQPQWAEAAIHISAPRNLKVQGVGDGLAARLTWNRVPGALGYNIYKDNRYIDTVFSTSTYVTGHGHHRFYVTAFDRSKTVFSTRSNTVAHSFHYDPWNCWQQWAC